MAVTASRVLLDPAAQRANRATMKVAGLVWVGRNLNYYESSGARVGG